MLFFTRDAFLRFSIDDLFVGDGELSRRLFGLRFSLPNRLGDAGSRLCQYRRGELEAKGDESKGDDSPTIVAFYLEHQNCSSNYRTP